MLVNLWKMTKFAGHYRSRPTSDERQTPLLKQKTYR